MSQMPPVSPGASHLAPHRGAVILVLGILGIFLSCFILGIIAWVMGNSDLRAMAEGRMDPTGEGLTKAGKICGIISVVLALIGVVFMILWFVVFAAAIGATAAGS